MMENNNVIEKNYQKTLRYNKEDTDGELKRNDE